MRLSSASSISVAIATYRGERFLKQQLDSIAQQTVLPFEIVITDDQSDDATIQVAEEFALRAPFPVRIYRNTTRLFYAENFLRAASLCEGDLIAYCDQDDLWLESKLSTCLKQFEDPEVQLVCHAAQTISGEGQLGYFFPHFKRTVVLEQGQCDLLQNLPGFCMVFRKKLLSSFPIAERPERLIPHDHYAWFVAGVTGKVVKLKNVLAYYRQHENNVFGAHYVSLGGKMKAATETPGYAKVATAEEGCSRFLAASAKIVDDRLKIPARRWAEKFSFRSELHWLRYDMYRRESRWVIRAKRFLQILLAGGYFPDLARIRLGPKAGLKDFVMGVAGVRRQSLP